jgi:hypothetical protein
VFIKIVPITLKIVGQIKARITDKSRKEKCMCPLSTRFSFMERSCFRHEAITKTFRITIKTSVDKGSEIPIMGSNSFIINPINIKNAMPNPTENSVVSVGLSFSNLRNLRMRKPGTKVR